MHSRKVFLSICLVVLLTRPSHALASETISSGQPDFKFLEAQRGLREDPNGPHARENLFAMGEYYFQENILPGAVDCFRRFMPRVMTKTEDLIASAYLVRCFSLTGNTQAALALKLELEEALSSRFFFASFHDHRDWSWLSPLGNRFNLSESIDRLDITLNDNPFYAIDLS